MTEWIPVSDKLPKPNQDVICFLKYSISGGRVEKRPHAITLTYRPDLSDLYCFYTFDLQTSFEIEYWMPLPEPPKKKHRCQEGR